MADNASALPVSRDGRLDPAPGFETEPDRFETVLSRTADPPGEDGWLFFQDTPWRGEVGDAAHTRRLAEGALGVPVESVSFSELRTEEAYLDELKTAIADDLGAFNADTVAEALKSISGAPSASCDTARPEGF